MLLEKASEKPLTWWDRGIVMELRLKGLAFRYAVRRVADRLAREWRWRTYSNESAAWVMLYDGTTFDYYSDGLLVAYDKDDKHMQMARTKWRMHENCLQFLYPPGEFGKWRDQRKEFQEAYQMYVARLVLK